ncbi:P-type conjugative transfer protein TrbJ [Bradyrhizobium sp. JR1.5]
MLTAARELQQINNQIQMLNNQAQSLVNQSKNLANLPMSTLAQLQSTIARTQPLLSQARALNVQGIQTVYSSSYRTAPVTGSNATLFTAAQTRWQNSVAAFEDR